MTQTLTSDIFGVSWTRGKSLIDHQGINLLLFLLLAVLPLPLKRTFRARLCSTKRKSGQLSVGPELVVVRVSCLSELC